MEYTGIQVTMAGNSIGIPDAQEYKALRPSHKDLVIRILQPIFVILQISISIGKTDREREVGFTAVCIR